MTADLHLHTMHMLSAAETRPQVANLLPPPSNEGRGEGEKAKKKRKEQRVLATEVINLFYGGPDCRQSDRFSRPCFEA